MSCGTNDAPRDTACLIPHRVQTCTRKKSLETSRLEHRERDIVLAAQAVVERQAHISRAERTNRGSLQPLVGGDEALKTDALKDKCQIFSVDAPLDSRVEIVVVEVVEHDSMGSH